MDGIGPIYIGNDLNKSFITPYSYHRFRNSYPCRKRSINHHMIYCIIMLIIKFRSSEQLYLQLQCIGGKPVCFNASIIIIILLHGVKISMSDLHSLFSITMANTPKVGMANTRTKSCIMTIFLKTNTTQSHHLKH